jgi:hypothetical protein
MYSLLRTEVNAQFGCPFTKTLKLAYGKNGEAFADSKSFIILA